MIPHVDILKTVLSLFIFIPALPGWDMDQIKISEACAANVIFPRLTFAMYAYTHSIARS